MRALGMVARILHSRNLRLLLVAFLAFNAAEYATWIAILLYAYQASGPGAVGVVALVQLVPAALAAPLAASAGDRYPRHRVLAAGYLTYAAGMAVTALTIALSAPGPVVYLVAAIAGAALVVVRPAQSALIPALSAAPDEVTAANGAAQVVEGAGIVLGPAVAAAVLTVVPPGAIFVIAAVSLLAGGLLILGVRPWSPEDGPDGIKGTDRIEPPGDQAGSRAFLTGFRAVLDDADARLVVGLMSARMVVVGASDVLFVLMALDLLDMGQTGAGILNAAFGVGTIAGGALTFVFAGRGRLAAFAIAGAGAWGVALGLSGWLASAPVAVLLLVGGSAGLAIVDLAGRTILQRAVRDEVLASVFGIQEGLAMGALALGAIGVPALVAVVGLTGAVVLVGAFLPLVVVVSWTRLRSLDRRAAPRVREIALLRRTGLFGPLPGPQLEGVVRHASWLTVPAGSAIIREGERGDRYYVLESGRVSVERGGRHLRNLAATGDGFGEIALLRDVPRTATVVATHPTTLLVIGRAAFLLAISGNPTVATRADRAAGAAIM
ncbi:MAG: MFS transporter [Candidatus Limnocylindrales bacterium]